MEGYVTTMLTIFKKATKYANKILYISLAAVILIAGGLLAFSLFGKAVWGTSDTGFLPFVRTETMYIIMIYSRFVRPPVKPKDIRYTSAQIVGKV